MIKKIISMLIIFGYIVVYLFAFNEYVIKYKTANLASIIGIETAMKLSDSLSGFEDDTDEKVTGGYNLVLKGSFFITLFVNFKYHFFEIIKKIFTSFYIDSLCVLYLLLIIILFSALSVDKNILRIDFILVNQKGRDSPQFI